MTRTRAILLSVAVAAAGALAMADRPQVENCRLRWVELRPHLICDPVVVRK